MKKTKTTKEPKAAKAAKAATVVEAAPTTPPVLVPVRHFSSVRKAREALKGKALELLEEYRLLIHQAAAAGEFEAALKAHQWLMDHIPADSGERVFDGSIDKVKQIDDGPRGPVINIGLKIGGIDTAGPNPKQIAPKSTTQVIQASQQIIDADSI